jgi:hypothetical protein
VADALPIFRLVFANPQDFCQGEIGQGGIAGQLNQALKTKSAEEIARLFFSTHVAPDNRGTHDAATFVKKDCAVHLAGEADASDIFAGEICFRERLANGEAGGAPPIFRLLLGPAHLRRSERLVIGCRGRDDAAFSINHDGARAAGSDINPK